MLTPSQPVDPSHAGAVRGPSERNNARGQATRLRIILAAERLFATEGITAVPLRDIGNAAGQRNHAAVQYHFGDRDEVIRGIMEYRGAESEQVRSDVVAGLMLSEMSPTVTDVIGAFVRPLAIHIKPDNHYLTFLSMYVTQEGGYQSLGVELNTGAQVVILRSLLGMLVPGVPDDVLEHRWWLVLSSAVHGLAMYQSAQRKRGLSSAVIDAQVDDLIQVLSAGMVAPCSAEQRTST